MEKEVIFFHLESSLKFLRYAQKLQSIIQCFFQSFHLLFGMRREPFHKPAKLLLCNRTNFGFCPWPLKLTGFQPFIKQEISIIFPDQPFDPVYSPSTKKIKGISFDRIFSQIRTYGICQTVNPGTKISITGNNKDLLKQVASFSTYYRTLLYIATYFLRFWGCPIFSFASSGTSISPNRQNIP